MLDLKIINGQSYIEGKLKNKDIAVKEVENVKGFAMFFNMKNLEK